MAKSKYFCGNINCIWCSNKKCTMDYITCKTCDERKINSVVVKTDKVGGKNV